MTAILDQSRGLLYATVVHRLQTSSIVFKFPPINMLQLRISAVISLGRTKIGEQITASSCFASANFLLNPSSRLLPSSRTPAAHFSRSACLEVISAYFGATSFSEVGGDAGSNHILSVELAGDGPFEDINFTEQRFDVFQSAKCIHRFRYGIERLERWVANVDLRTRESRVATRETRF